MFTKLLISFVCVLTLALAATTYAADAPLLIGDWQQSFDHWSLLWGDTVGNYMFGFSAVGATLNDRALKFVETGGDWSNGMFLKLQGYSNQDVDIFGTAVDMEAWFSANCQYDALAIDVTRLAKDWIPTGAAPRSELCMIFNWGANGITGWDFIGTGGPHPGVPGSQSSTWDGLANDTRTVVYDLSAAKANWKAAFDLASDPSSWCELVLLPWNADYLDPKTYYFDNARLIPESATIALLGLGGLSLIRRKR